MRSDRERVLENLTVLASLAERHGLTLLLHPQLWRLVEPTAFEASIHEDDAGFLREAMDAVDKLAVGCSVQIPSGLAAADYFPRTMLPVRLAGRPYASVRFSNSREPSIELHGTDTVLADIGEIAGGLASPARPGVTDREAPISSEEAWAAYEAALAEEAERRAQYERERPQREAEAAARAREREAERRQREAERRAARQSRLEARHGALVLRVTDDRGSTEIRQFSDGRVDCVWWEDDWESFDDLVGGFYDDDPFGEEPDDDRPTPSRIETFSSIVDCLRSRMTPRETEPSLVLGAPIERIESMFVDAGLAEFALSIDHDEFVFDGEHIVSADFARATSLSQAEDALKEIWSFHAGVEGPRWTSEIYEMIGSTNGVFFYIERDDEDGSITKLGRMSREEALEVGLRDAVRSDETRRELLRNDPDSDENEGDGREDDDDDDDDDDE